MHIFMVNISVAVQFYPWFKFHFPWFLDMVMHDNKLHYYTLYSLSVFSLAESLQLILETDLQVARAMHDFQLQYQFKFLATVCLSLFSSKQCIIKQLLDSVFVIP